jgi:hypothetical protein
MAQPTGGHEGRKLPLYVAEGIVGHHGTDGDSERGKPGERVLEEDNGAGGRLIGQQLRKRNAGAIVDRDVQTLPTQSGLPIPSGSLVGQTTARGAIPPDPPQPLDIEMQQLAGLGTLVAHDRGTRHEGRQTAEPEAAKDVADGGEWQL